MRTIYEFVTRDNCWIWCEAFATARQHINPECDHGVGSSKLCHGLGYPPRQQVMGEIDKENVLRSEEQEKWGP